MCTGGESNQGPLGPKSDTLSTAPLRPSIKAMGCTFRVTGGDVLSGAGIPAAVEEAWSSGGVLTDGSSELQLRNLP